MRFQVDLRFVEVKFEIALLREYARMAERSLSSIRENGEAQLWEGLDPEDDADRQIGDYLQQLHESGATTRFLPNALIIAVWSLYETAIEKTARYAAHTRGLSIEMHDLKGDLLTRAKKYLRDGLNIDLCPENTDWVRIVHLADLRNALAHSNGRVPDIPKRKAPGLMKWIQQEPEIQVAQGEYIVVGIAFAQEAISFIETQVLDLIDRVPKE